MSINKKIFEVEIEGKKVKLSVVRPSNKVNQEGNKILNKTFADIIKADGIVREAINRVMREQKLWDDAREQEYEKLRKALNDNELKLASGGIKLSEGRSIALEMADDRAKLQEMVAERNQLDAYTAQGQAENARFGYWVSQCTHYEEPEKFGQKFFKSYEDYLNRVEDGVVNQIASEMGKLLYEVEDDWRKKLPEWAFLLRYKFVDDKLRLINRDGKLCDREYRLINEKGQLVDSDGNIIDEEGRRINADGGYMVEFTGFENDLGWPVESEAKQPEEASVSA